MTTFFGTECKIRYTKLNCGAISAQDIFDKTMDDTIHGLIGLLHIRDDFIVFGKTVQECGLTFNPEKMQSDVQTRKARKQVVHSVIWRCLPHRKDLGYKAYFCGPFPTDETVLVVLDAYSKYPEVAIVPSNTEKDTIQASIFATHGIPEVLKTDNDPPFQGHAFQSFAKEKGSTHRKITPLCLEANGHVEGFIKNLGKVTGTAHSQGKDWKGGLYVFFLANYRATPHQVLVRTLISHV